MSALAILAGAALSFVPAEGTRGEDCRWQVVATGALEGAKLTLHRVGAAGEVGEELFGSVEGTGDRLVFRPAVRLSPGETYRALLSRGRNTVASEDFRLPEGEKTAPRVLRVLPSCEAVPANLLKFYLAFDRPMREGPEIFDQVMLLDAEGGPVHAPWRRQELWTRDSRRLTLWIHPGRVKRGVNLREEMGPVLEPERTYTLRISGEVRAANGARLGGDGFSISFRTTAELRAPIDVSQWRIELPTAGTREALKVIADRALDPHLFRRHIAVRRGGEPVERGRVTWQSDLRTFSWKPAKRWQAGEHELVAGAFLEDLAGNTPARAFDTDLDAPPPAVEDRIGFVVE